MRNRSRTFSVMLAGLIAASFFLTGCTTTGPQPDTHAARLSRREAIDSNVNATMTRLYSSVRGSRELVSRAQGVLVFPDVIQAGLFVGAQTGDGALLIRNRPAGYYNTSSISVGLQAGAQSKAVIFLFMTREALASFRAADGWSADANASVAVLKLGANGEINTTTAIAPVEVVILTNAGLMGDVSLGGTKVTRLAL